MSIKIGDRVAYKRSDAVLLHSESWGLSFIDNLKNKGSNRRKGVVTKIKTHNWFFFQNRTPYLYY